jgi:hypothetical protein
MPDGNIGFSCKCNALEPSTIVDDIAGFFTSSKVGEIFSVAVFNSNYISILT